MSTQSKYTLADEAATLAYGRELAAQLKGNELIFLIGDLGMGKTTLARGLINGSGIGGRVKSPTYTLVEPYENDNVRIYHFDFYRIENPDELDFIGLEEMLAETAIKLIEWPERASGKLPDPDIVITLTENQAGRILEYSKFT